MLVKKGTITSIATRRFEYLKKENMMIQKRKNRQFRKDMVMEKNP